MSGQGEGDAASEGRRGRAMAGARRVFLGIVVTLIVLGAATAAWRSLETGIPLLPGAQQPSWLVEARVDFEAQGDAVRVSLNIPDDPAGFSVALENTASPGYGFSILESEPARRGEWTIREADGAQTLYYKIHLIPKAIEHREVPEEQWPEPPAPPTWEGADETAAAQILEQARAASSTPESLTRELLRAFHGERSGNAELLLEDLDTAAAVTRLLHEAGVPARSALGLQLEDGRRNQSPVELVEVFVDGRWLPFNPETGEQGLEPDMLLWHQGGDSLIDLFGGRNARVSFSLNQQILPARELAQMEETHGVLDLLTLYQLPIEQQAAFKLLLLLPLGALATVFLRVVVGIRTSGTFMPVLIALAFLQTQLFAGLASFIGIVGLGLLVRGYLSRLNLLLVSRIATVIVIVVFLIALVSLLGYQLGFAPGMTLAFFPIIIIAWTIERMSILWEEEGPREVLVQGGGSLLVALIAYVVMSRPLAEHLTFNFPELNLIVVALIMLLGQYTGYRLMELQRFSALRERAD